MVSRTQLAGLGVDDSAIETAVRRRVLVRAGRGVYVDHTGALSWEQSVWVACLRYSPAVADPLTTLALERIVDRPTQVGVMVAWSRRVGGEPRVRVRRTRAFHAQARLDLHPPRLRLDHAAIERVAVLDDEQAVVGLLADVVGCRRTTASRLGEQAATTPRIARRDLVTSVLADLEAGVSSNLERLYLHRVERAHGLPSGLRQVRTRVRERWTYRDVDYLDRLLVVGLDGRAGHDTSPQRWADAERDLVTALQGGRTLRLVWQQVLDSCRAAAVVGDLLGAVGWRGRPRACGPGCSVR